MYVAVIVHKYDEYYGGQREDIVENVGAMAQAPNETHDQFVTRIDRKIEALKQQSISPDGLTRYPYSRGYLDVTITQIID